jgi:threonyl-tRNA synthetase
MLVVGDDELAKGAVSVRLRSEENLGPKALSDLMDLLNQDLGSID